MSPLAPGAVGIRAGGRRRTVSTVAPSQHGTIGLYSNTGSANAFINVPAETLIGDLLIAHVVDVLSGSTSITPPAGWTVPTGNNVNDGAADLSSAVMYKFAVASDVQTGLGGSASSAVQYQAGLGGTHKALAVCAAITGVNATTPIHLAATPTITNTAGTSHSYPTLTTTVDKCMVVGFGAFRNNGSGLTNNDATPPAGWTEKQDYQTNAAGTVNAAGEYIEQIISPAGTPSNLAITIVNSSKSIMHTIALLPA